MAVLWPRSSTRSAITRSSWRGAAGCRPSTSASTICVLRSKRGSPSPRRCAAPARAWASSMSTYSTTRRRCSPSAARPIRRCRPRSHTVGTLLHRGGALGEREPQAGYVPAGGGSSPTFSSSKLFERLGNRRMDGVFDGELAEAWKPAADYKSYTIKIREGVKFHDGKDMTVDDVVYSVSEIWKKYAATSALTDFASVEARAARAALEGFASVEAPDAETVVITFNKPTPEFFFASMMCGTVAYIVPKHIYAGSDPITNPANNAPIGTGPWKFKEWVRGSHFEYARNENYWREELPY